MSGSDSASDSEDTRLWERAGRISRQMGPSRHAGMTATDANEEAMAAAVANLTAARGGQVDGPDGRDAPGWAHQRIPGLNMISRATPLHVTTAMLHSVRRSCWQARQSQALAHGNRHATLHPKHHALAHATPTPRHALPSPSHLRLAASVCRHLASFALRLLHSLFAPSSSPPLLVALSAWLPKCFVHRCLPVAIPLADSCACCCIACTVRNHTQSSMSL